MYVRRSGSRWSGCVRPRSSVARAITVAGPGRSGTAQGYSHSRQANGTAASSNFAAAQLRPPSVLTSTFATAASPAHAAPKTRYGLPAGTVSCTAGRATAAEVQSDLPGRPSDSTVRTQLRVLETKGHVRHETDGQRYVYLPAVPRHAARRSALRHLVDTFFDGSAEKVVGALLGADAGKLSDAELARIAEIVERVRKEPR